jgi:hypothetical protein
LSVVSLTAALVRNNDLNVCHGIMPGIAGVQWSSGFLCCCRNQRVTEIQTMFPGILTEVGASCAGRERRVCRQSVTAILWQIGGNCCIHNKPERSRREGAGATNQNNILKPNKRKHYNVWIGGVNDTRQGAAGRITTPEQVVWTA